MIERIGPVEDQVWRSAAGPGYGGDRPESRRWRADGNAVKSRNDCARKQWRWNLRLTCCHLT